MKRITAIAALALLFAAGTIDAKATTAVIPTEHYICGPNDVTYTGSEIVVDGWRFTQKGYINPKLEAVIPRVIAYTNTNRQQVVLLTDDHGQVWFAGDYYPRIECK